MCVLKFETINVYGRKCRCLFVCCGGLKHTFLLALIAVLVFYFTPFFSLCILTMREMSPEAFNIVKV